MSFFYVPQLSINIVIDINCGFTVCTQSICVYPQSALNEANKSHLKWQASSQIAIVTSNFDVCIWENEYDSISQP